MKKCPECGCPQDEPGAPQHDNWCSYTETAEASSTSGMTSAELLKTIERVFRKLPDNRTVSLGIWMGDPGTLDYHFNALLAIKVGDIRQLANDFAPLA